MLNPTALRSDLSSAMNTAYDAGEVLSTAEEVENAREEILQQLITDCAKAVQSYLEEMIDPTSDVPASIPISPLKGIFEALYSLDYIEDQDVDLGSIIQADAQASWASLFPISFKTSTPPPGGASEVSAIASSPTQLAPFSAGYNYSPKSGFVDVLVNSIHTAASQITVLITYLNSDGSTLTTSGLVS